MQSSGILPSRDVAQPGRALAWGARGRQFKSARPDHFSETLAAGSFTSFRISPAAPASLTPAKRLNLGCEGSAVQICPSRPFNSSPQSWPWPACPNESPRTKKNTLIPSTFPRQSQKAVPGLRGPQRRSRRALFQGVVVERSPHREILMSGEVILYFDDQADALRFALAAGSVMAGDDARATDDLVQETSRVSRIRLDATNAGKIKKPSPERVA